MERSPVGTHGSVNKGANKAEGELELTPPVSPSVAVRRVHVDAKVQQELDDVVMSCTHCVVQGCDSLIVGSAGIIHLGGTTT